MHVTVNDVPEGAYIVEVVVGSSAADGGIVAGDIITKMNDKDIDEESGTLAEIINTLKPGEKVQVVLWRDGEEITLAVTMKVGE